MQLHYRDTGPQGEAIPVILIHGLFGSLDNLSQLARALRGERRVISLDMRNHGASPRAASMSYPEMAADVLALMDTLALPHAHLVGHSLGGKIAMATALAYPARISSLVVADMAPVPYATDRHQSVFAALAAVRASGAQDRQAADLLLRDYLPDAGVRQFLLKSFLLQDGRPQWRFNLDAIRSEYPRLMAWPSPPAPYPGRVLFIKGARSDYLLPEHQATIAAQFPAAQARIILEAGHWLHAEKPLIFNRLVVDFLSVTG